MKGPKTFLVSLAVGCASSILTFLFFKMPASTAGMLSSAITFGIAITFLTHFALSEDKRVKEINRIRESITLQETRTDKLVEYFGLCGGHFAESLLAMRRLEGTVKWLAAQFLSEKMAIECPREGTISLSNIELRQFAEIQGRLVKHCSESAYWTCPYTPTQFFTLMLKKNMKLLKIVSGGLNVYRETSKSALIQEVKKELSYLLDFTRHRVRKEKRRLINLSSQQYEAMLRDPLLELFFQVNDLGYNLKVADIGKVGFSDPAKANCDFSIYDGQVVVEWKRHSETGDDVEKGDATIVIGPGVSPYKELFDENKWPKYKGVKDILEEAFNTKIEN